MKIVLKAFLSTALLAQGLHGKKHEHLRHHPRGNDDRELGTGSSGDGNGASCNNIPGNCCCINGVFDCNPFVCQSQTTNNRVNPNCWSYNIHYGDGTSMRVQTCQVDDDSPAIGGGNQGGGNQVVPGGPSIGTGGTTGDENRVVDPNPSNPCAQNIPNHGEPFSTYCDYGCQCASGQCWYSEDTPEGTCNNGNPGGFSLKPPHP